MRKKPKNFESWQAKLGTTALDPLEAFDLQDAIRSNKERCMLQDREFIIKYYVGKDGRRKIFYRPTLDFGPCGHLDVERFLSGV